MNKRIPVLALALTLAVAAVPALAQGKGGNARFGGGPGFHGGAGLRGVLSQLDLSEEQRTAIHAIFDEMHPQLRDARMAVAEAQRAVREATRASGYDEAALRPLAENQGAAVVEQTLLEAQLHARVRAELTEEQIAQLDAWREELADGGHQGRGPRGRRGPRGF